MAYRFYNPNPRGALVGDCVIRALSKVFKTSWEKIYIDLSLFGFSMGDIPNSNAVWGSYLKSKDYMCFTIPNTCPDCYTVKDFCEDHPEGTFVLATGTHVIAVIDGDYYDAWDSGLEIPTYYWRK